MCILSIGEAGHSVDGLLRCSKSEPGAAQCLALPSRTTTGELPAAGRAAQDSAAFADFAVAQRFADRQRTDGPRRALHAFLCQDLMPPALRPHAN